MDIPCVYGIRVEGHLADGWSDWFEGLVIRNEPSSEAILTGFLTDQAALFGVLTKIRNLNLVLVSVYRLPSGKEKIYRDRMYRLSLPALENNQVTWNELIMA